MLSLTLLIRPIKNAPIGLLVRLFLLYLYLMNNDRRYSAKTLSKSDPSNSRKSVVRHHSAPVIPNIALSSLSTAQRLSSDHSGTRVTTPRLAATTAVGGKPVFVNNSSTDVANAPSTPLAIYSARAAASPTNSPRVGETPEGSPPSATSSPRQALVNSGRALLKLLLTPRKTAEKESADDDADDEVKPRTSLERSKSMPTTPGKKVAELPTRDISDILGTNHLQSPRTFHDCSSMSSSPRDTKKRHSMYLRATEGGSARFGASGTLDFDTVTNEPLLRVRSHSSIDDLKRRLKEDAELAALKSSSPPPTSRSRSGSASSSESSNQDPTTTTSTTSSGSDSTRRKSPMVKLRRLSMRLIAPETYTLIEYNPDMLGAGKWVRFLVPNTVIDPSIHTLLERATNSDLIDPWRVCECSENCREHEQPDAVAKVAAVYLVDTNLGVSSQALKDILIRIIATFKQKRILFHKDMWKAYRVKDDQHIDLESLNYAPRYRFKMFI